MSKAIALGVVLLVLVAVALFAEWQSARLERPAPGALLQARERHPSRPRRVPGLPVDGEPLEPADWDEFIGCLWASNQVIDEPTYGDRNG